MVDEAQKQYLLIGDEHVDILYACVFVVNVVDE